MSRTINSPGVEIREKDISLRAPTLAGTTVFVTGYADQGPTDEVVSPSSLSEFVNVYGLPTNAAERYFHHTVRAAYQSSADVLVNRLPWGANTGEGFGSKVGILAYPVVALSSSDSTYTDTLSTGVALSSTGNVTYVYGEPTQFNVTKGEYLQILNGETFDWENSPSSSAGLSALTELGGAGMLVFNKSQTVIDNKYRGHYVGIADNTNINPASAYDAILNAKTVTAAAESTGLTNYTTIPHVRLKTALSATEAGGSNPAVNSVSEIMESKIAEYDTSTRSFDDTLNVGLFKLRQSTFLTDATTLDIGVTEAYNAAFGSTRQIYNQQGGQPVNFFIENVINDVSPNLHVLVNPYVSKQLSQVVLNNDGTPVNKVRVYTDQLVDNLNNGNIDVTVAGTTHAALTAAAGSLTKADSIVAVGAYSESYTSDVETKDCGNLPSKIERSLDLIRNDEVYDVDVVVEGGLGSVWVGLSGNQGFYFEDRTASGVSGLRSGNPTLEDTSARDNYMAVYNKFATLASPPQDGGRGDVILVADPIRQILVTGTNNKVINDPSKVFTTDIYWAMRHQFENIDTSYTAVPANWVRVFDDQSSANTWVPASGFIAALMASTDSEIGPWSAPAGFNRGILRGVADVAFSPNQRQRDDLYKINLNPVAAFQNQGISFFGQKTMSRKPSAFDRINVRRLFLYLEKITKKTMQYFVFEPNTVFTRSRVVNTLTPLFERVKAADGLYDYIVICDERNNTPDIIDNNELIVDVYLKPTRTAEFITVNFIATRSDANFEELAS